MSNIEILRYCSYAACHTKAQIMLWSASRRTVHTHIYCISNAIVSHLIFIGPHWTSTMRAACFQFIFDFESRNEMKTAFIKGCVCVCSLICLVLGRNRQPHRIDFVNCSLFAFHSGLVELSAVISVIALPFSVNTRARLPYPLPPPPWGTICWLYVVYLIENFAQLCSIIIFAIFVCACVCAFYHA